MTDEEREGRRRRVTGRGRGRGREAQEHRVNVLEGVTLDKGT